VEEELDDGLRALRHAVDAARRGGTVVVRGAAPDALADLARGLRGDDVGLVVVLGDGPVPEALAGLPVFEAAPAGGRGRALRRRGLVELRSGAVTLAGELLAQSAALLAAAEPALALRALVEAGEAAAYEGDLARAAALARETRALAGAVAGDAECDRVLAFAEGMARVFEGNVVGAAPLLREVVAAGRRASDPVAVMQGGMAATLTGMDSAARALHARAVERARAAGDRALVAHALEFLVIADLFNGRYEAALRHAEEGRALADEVGHLNTACHHTAMLALIAGLRGRPLEAREHAVAALEHADASSLGFACALATWGLALADLAEDRHEAAADRLAALATAGPGAGHPLVSVVAAPTLVEAAAASGDDAMAARALRSFEIFARSEAQGWASAFVARCRALLARGVEADAHFARAILLHARAGLDLERARTELLWGQALRRQARDADARPHLRAAMESLCRLGGGAWLEQARAALADMGESVGGRTQRQATDLLTPREREIVELVALGATNREVAGRLELSPRTVDHHLRQVFSKLGISSRAELMVPAHEER
jgi:ATP/maltotriose-dependent transcriptional regulator MalT